MKSRGDSGLDMTQAFDDKVTIVGTNPNIFPSCRIDGAGRSKIAVDSSASQGVLISPSAYTESAAIDNSGDHHGGTYTIIAMNKFCVDTGTGGISFNSAGNINLLAGGGIINLVGTESVNAISNVIKLTSSEVTIIKGPELYIENDKITFVNTVRLAKNLLVGGSALINGELYINHLTGPQQIMDTSMSPILPVFFNTPTVLTGIISQTCINPTMTLGGPAVPAQSTSYIQFTLDPMTTTQAQGRVLPHKHTYKHIACDFKQSNGEVWAESESVGSNEMGTAKKTENFGAPQSQVLDKCKKRFINAFTDTISSLMKSVF